jgi:predicted lysophospholipase L1 biosynthesis ABC-type transport system permease subunit
MYADEAPVLVSNLNYLELYTIGVLPHDVWLTLEPGTDSEAVIADVRRLQVKPKSVQDLNHTLDVESGRLERVGVFGLLSFCFVAGAVLSVADLIVYSTAMLRERSIRHAVLRALGLERPTVMNVVMLEGIVSVCYGLALGIACGVACARLYVPYFPLTNVATVPIPPFIPFVDWVRTGWIAGIMALALLATELVVLVRMTRARVFEVLRLGNRP